MKKWILALLFLVVACTPESSETLLVENFTSTPGESVVDEGGEYDNLPDGIVTVPDALNLPEEDAGVVYDAGDDAGWDAGQNSGQDAGQDAGWDAGYDSGIIEEDAGQDAGQDAGYDAGPPDPCEDVLCETPPANYCTGGDLYIYDSTGTCAEGECSYGGGTSPCTFGCTGDSCDVDPCEGITCVTPPSDYCDEDTLYTYASSGVCSGGDCEYDEYSEVCTFGCESAACAADPCAEVVCDSPPEDECLSTSQLRNYEDTGTCVDGDCVYDSSTDDCAGACAVDHAGIDICIDTPCNEVGRRACNGGDEYNCLDTGYWWRLWDCTTIGHDGCKTFANGRQGCYTDTDNSWYQSEDCLLPQANAAVYRCLAKNNGHVERCQTVQFPSLEGTWQINTDCEELGWEPVCSGGDGPPLCKWGDYFYTPDSQLY